MTMHRRGLTLLELLLAMTITAMVAAAIAGMLGAVIAGVSTRKDNRTVMVLAHAAQSRLSAYLATARCVLASGDGSLTIWLDDSRESDTVHATEIRWLSFDAHTGTVNVHYVDFPETWTKTACDLEDLEYPADTAWETVLAEYHAKRLISTRTLVDNLDSLVITLDNTVATAARQVAFTLGFETARGAVEVQASSAIRVHSAPAG